MTRYLSYFIIKLGWKTWVLAAMSLSNLGNEAIDSTSLPNSKLMLHFLYNNKINYLMCKWLVSPRKNHNEFNLRKVFDGNRRAITKDERRIIAFKSAFLFLNKGEINKAITCLNIFYNIDIRRAFELHAIVSNKIPNFDLFIYIITSSDLPEPYLVLYFNSLLLRANNTPIIFRKQQINLLKQMILYNEFNSAKQLYDLCLNNSKRHLYTNTYNTREDIINILLTIKSDLKKNNVKELLIYGSVARDEITPCSDLDLLIVTLCKNINDEYSYALQELVETTVFMKVDLHIFYKELDFSFFDNKIMKDMVSVFKI